LREKRKTRLSISKYLDQETKKKRGKEQDKKKQPRRRGRELIHVDEGQRIGKGGAEEGKGLGVPKL